MSKVAVYTLGCKVNQYETESILEVFREKGYEIVDFDEYADVYIINTCTVTNIADKKSRQMINKARKENREAVIVVMGCYAQASPNEVSKIEGVSLIIGTNNRKRVVELVEEYKNNRNKISTVEDIMKIKEFEELPFATVKERTRAFLKVQDGCNQFCTYCIIPYTRGPIRSRNLESILDEIKALTKEGYEEFVLTGIHIESYGTDFKDKKDLAYMISEIDKIEGVKRIRLSSLEPNLISDDFLDRLKSNKLCDHFHLSLQSGSDEILKSMNRKYNTLKYERGVKLLREKYPDAAITTDIIVGFPGETETDFEESYNFAKRIDFSKIHVFKYSPRKGTKAAEFPNQINPIEKEKRSKRLIDLSEGSQRNFNKRFLGKVKDVLFETRLKDNQDYIEGLTTNYIRVVCKGSKDQIGKILKVKIETIKEDYVLGSIV